MKKILLSLLCVTTFSSIAQIQMNTNGNFNNPSYLIDGPYLDKFTNLYDPDPESETESEEDHDSDGDYINSSESESDNDDDISEDESGDEDDISDDDFENRTGSLSCRRHLDSRHYLFSRPNWVVLQHYEWPRPRPVQ